MTCRRFNCGASLRVAQAVGKVKNVELAQLMGVSPQLISKWRTQRHLRLETVEQLCEHLGVDPITFLEMGSEA